MNPCSIPKLTKVNIFPKCLSLKLIFSLPSNSADSVFNNDIKINEPTHKAKTEYIGAIPDP